MPEPAAGVNPAPRVVFLAGPATYRRPAFLAAAARLGLAVTEVIDTPAAMAGPAAGVDFTAPDAGAQIAALASHTGSRAVLALDDGATLVAAAANATLGRPFNDPAAAIAARDKFVMRERLAAGGVPVPAFRRVPLHADPWLTAAEIPYPSVVKPLRLAGSRGVIRVDDPSSFVAAWRRTRALVIGEGADPVTDHLLVETYLPGVEVALEGLLSDGALQTLALFDKPDPLVGPFFEETIYVTPSRLDPATQAAVAARTAAAARALGLRHGPVHAELRLNEAGIWLIEIAGRSIGGLCSSVLEFGLDTSLETLILRHAVGWPLPDLPSAADSPGAGVMMIPIPRGGMFRGVSGEAAARAVPGITGLEITAPFNQPLVPLPEGASYLGFLFARAATPAAAEAALREAHALLRFQIEPTIALTPTVTRVG